MLDVSIIIINYNTPTLTINTIKSIIRQVKEISFEIIIVDNNSNDNSIKELKNYIFLNKEICNIKLVCSFKNLGFGGGNNLGIDLSEGKYIFCLNSDTILLNNVLKIFYEYMEKNDKVGVCGGNLFNENLEPTHSYFKTKTSLKHEFRQIYDYIYVKIKKRRNDFNFTDLEKNVGHITGADMFVRRNVFEKVGKFDEDFFMYYEEAELSNRIKKAGYIIKSIPQAKIIHLEGKSTNFKERRFLMSMESKYKYYYKTYGLFQTRLSYYLSQLKYIISYLNGNKEKIKLNKKQYQIFLDNYIEKNLKIRKEYEKKYIIIEK